MEVQHIHEVIFLLQERSDQEFSKDQLMEAISEKWGTSINFMACSGEPFPKELATDFLSDRNKIVQLENGNFMLHPGLQICDGHKNFQAPN